MNGSKGNRIERFLERRFGKGFAPIPLRGDASTRLFFRLPLAGRSAVMVVHDGVQGGAERDYIDVRNHLAACGVRVPEIYEHDEETGILIVEDFGDATLEKVVKGGAAAAASRLYERAIDELVEMHVIGTAADGECVAFGRAFDEQKLMSELDFFIEHTVRGCFGASPGAGEMHVVREGFRRLCAELAALPRVFTHRDYHSRNIMVIRDSIGIVDFQDARMGPCQYDLASLLKDSYVKMDVDLRTRMLARYMRRSAERGVDWGGEEEFVRRFELAGIQRNIKACGTFGYMAVVKGNRRYLECIAPTWDCVREAARRFPRLSECINLLSGWMPG